MRQIVPAIIVITVGLGWLLTTHGVLPGVNWVWVLALGISGVAVLIVGGLNRTTAVIGPFLILCTFFALLRQTGRISLETEVPVLVIVFGALMLIARLLPLPEAQGSAAKLPPGFPPRGGAM